MMQRLALSQKTDYFQLLYTLDALAVWMLNLPLIDCISPGLVSARERIKGYAG